MSSEPPPPNGELGAIQGITPEELREKMLEGLPSKTLRKRSKQVLTNNPDSPPEIGANSRTIPGIMTQRGGPYAAFTGAINFYKEVDRMLSSKVWSYVVPPWVKDRTPVEAREVAVEAAVA